MFKWCVNYLLSCAGEPVRPIDPGAWVAHTNAMKGKIRIVMMMIMMMVKMIVKMMMMMIIIIIKMMRMMMMMMIVMMMMIIIIIIIKMMRMRMMMMMMTVITMIISCVAAFECTILGIFICILILLGEAGLFNNLTFSTTPHETMTEKMIMMMVVIIMMMIMKMFLEHLNVQFWGEICLYPNCLR